jgi:glutaredoxin 3
MKRVEVYTAPSCPYCVQAKRLLEARSIPYAEIDLGNDPALRAEIMARTGRRTVPQIFIDGESIGGYDDLKAMDVAGALRELFTA